MSADKGTKTATPLPSRMAVKATGSIRSGASAILQSRELAAKATRVTVVRKAFIAPTLTLAPTLSLALTLSLAPTLSLTLAPTLAPTLSLALSPSHGHPSTHTRNSLSQAATQLLSFMSQYVLQPAQWSLHNGTQADV